MSATWCGPCYSLIPYFDEVLETWSGYEHFIGIIALSDLNQPYSCTQWGNLGTSGIPLIIDDTGYPMFNMFNTESAFPSTVYIDHNMKVHYKEAGYSASFANFANSMIEDMVFIMVPDSHTYDEGVTFSAYVGGGGTANLIFSDGGATVTEELDLGGGGCQVLGDANDDATINVLDVVLTVNLILCADCPDNYNACSDINGDELINVLDVVSLVNLILGRN